MASLANSHTHRVFSVLEDRNSATRSAIAASWSRSLMQYGLDPEKAPPPARLSGEEFRQVRQSAEPLLTSARDTIDRLYQSVGGRGCCVALCDVNGVILDRRSNDDEFPDLMLGTVWSEAAAGTNGLGTSLREGRAVMVHKDQHFLARHIHLSCIAAPIRDERGRITGALDVSMARSDITDPMLKLIVNATNEAAQRIEMHHFRQTFRDSRILVLPDLDGAAGGMVAVDRYDLVVGANHAARRAYGINDRDLSQPFPADQLFKPDQSDMSDLDLAEYGAVQRALSRAGGNISVAAQSLRISRQTLHRKLSRFRNIHDGAVGPDASE